MTGYKKLKATIEILYDHIGTLEEMLQKMGLPEEVIISKRRERNAKLYALEHEER